MKKLIYTEDFERRFSTAAKNGSKVCADILKAIKTPNNVEDGVTANYLTTVRVSHGSAGDRQIRSVKVTYCSKDFTNENNPEHGSPVGMWRRENRAATDLQRMVGWFKSLNIINYTSEDFHYAAEILSVDEPLKCVILKGMANIEKLYNSANYSLVSSQNDTLWNSCMRHEDTAAAAGDFYANFCGAKIIGVIGATSGSVYGRAILWPNITINSQSGAFLDRVYFTHDAIRKMVYKFAQEQGVVFRKYQNTYDSKTYFVRFDNPDVKIRAVVTIEVPQVKWHKNGSPYTDTFSYINFQNDKFYLSNYCDDYTVYATDYTGTHGHRVHQICPVCGTVHSNDTVLCRSCYRDLMRDTLVGKIYIGKANKKGEPILPKKYAEAANRLANL